MPEAIPGTGLDKKQAMILGGVVAAGVAVVVYIRYKAAQEAPPPEGFPMDQPMSGGGGGGGIVSVPAPTQAVADQYEQGMRQAELDAANLQNSYMQEQLRQNTSQFNLAERLNGAYENLQEQLFGVQAGVEKARGEYQQQLFGVQAGVEKSRGEYQQEQYRSAEAAQEIATRTIQKKGKIECPKGEHFVVGEGGTSGCQPLGSGGFNPGRLLRNIGDGVQEIIMGAGRGAARGAEAGSETAVNAYLGGLSRKASNKTSVPTRRATASPAHDTSDSSSREALNQRFNEPGLWF
jgi:hypothetical protein